MTCAYAYAQGKTLISWFSENPAVQRSSDGLPPYCSQDGCKFSHGPANALHTDWCQGIHQNLYPFVLDDLKWGHWHCAIMSTRCTFQMGWATLWMRCPIPGEEWWEDNQLILWAAPPQFVWVHKQWQGIHECSREASGATEILGDWGGRDFHQCHPEHWRWATVLRQDLNRNKNHVKISSWNIFWKLMTATDHLGTNWGTFGDRLVTSWWQLRDHLTTTWWSLGDHLA